MKNRCTFEADCLTDRKECATCIRNFKYKDISDKLTVYKSVCPLGETDCINDPAYIYYYDTTFYSILYGDIPPEEAVKIRCNNYIENGICRHFENQE